MAVRVRTSTPARLLRAVVHAIQSGEVGPWETDDDGDLQYTGRAGPAGVWFTPSVRRGRLDFNIITAREVPLTTRTYARVHARLVEMLLAYFDEHFEYAIATADPAEDDLV